MMRLLAAALLLCASATALARLAPGAQIRDIHNRLVLPSAIPPGSIVRILTPQEAAQSAPAK